MTVRREDAAREPRAAPDVSEHAKDLRDWGLVVLLCVSAALSAGLEVLFIPLYVGSVLVPVVVLAAIVVNIVLPGWGYRAVSSLGGGLAPLLCWLVLVLVLTLYPRAEGDVLVLGGGGQVWTFYGVVLLGSAAGFTTIARQSAAAAPRPGRPSAPPRPDRPLPGNRLSR